MRTVIVFYIIIFLLPAFEEAQAGPPLGASCHSTAKRLTIPYIVQRLGTSWCWAAAAQNVMGFHSDKYLPPMTNQCDLVKNVVQYWDRVDLPCCEQAMNQCMSETGLPEDVFDHKDYHVTYQPSVFESKTLSWTEATEELCQNRPFISFIQYRLASPHYVVVIGYRIRNGQNEIEVYDPEDPPLEGTRDYRPYDEFFNEVEHLGDTFQIRP